MRSSRVIRYQPLETYVGQPLRVIGGRVEVVLQVHDIFTEPGHSFGERFAEIVVDEESHAASRRSNRTASLTSREVKSHHARTDSIRSFSARNRS